MEKEKQVEEKVDEDEVEPVELVLFQVSECYVYMIPPRKTAASYRADEWNVNKWAWEGTLKVISKGVECIIRLEDKTTGELYARAFLREGEPHPVEPVIDSSRYFVLRVEENIGLRLPALEIRSRMCMTIGSAANLRQKYGRLRHAFIGIGFRERTEAYDFQAALHDHMKYLNKKKVAEEMEQQYQQTSSVDYSLKDGETLVLQLKNKGAGGSVKSKFFELNNLSLEDKSKNKETSVGIKLPPPPAPLSPVAAPVHSPFRVSPKINLESSSEMKPSESEKHQSKESESESESSMNKEGSQDIPDDDFGDFQAAG